MNYLMRMGEENSLPGLINTKPKKKQEFRRIIESAEKLQ